MGKYWFEKILDEILLRQRLLFVHLLTTQNIRLHLSDWHFISMCR